MNEIISLTTTCYVVETDHPHTTYQETLKICSTQELAEQYKKILQKPNPEEHDSPIPMRVTKKEFHLDVTNPPIAEFLYFKKNRRVIK